MASGGPLGVLYVSVHRASDLPDMDGGWGGGHSDPYVLTSIDGVHKSRTDTVTNCSSPVWNQGLGGGRGVDFFFFLCVGRKIGRLSISFFVFFLFEIFFSSLCSRMFCFYSDLTIDISGPAGELAFAVCFLNFNTSSSFFLSFLNISSQIWDDDTGRTDDLIGEVKIPLEAVFEGSKLSKVIYFLITFFK